MFDTVSSGVPPALSASMGQLENAFRRLTALVEGMGQEELEHTGPPGNVNSTAMLLRHLEATDLIYLLCIKGEPVSPELEAEYEADWAEGNLPPVTGKSAAELLAACGRVLEMVRAHLSTLSDEDATRPVTVPWWPQPATVRYVLWHMAAHAMHHQGQIALLRRHYRERSA